MKLVILVLSLSLFVSCTTTPISSTPDISGWQPAWSAPINSAFSNQNMTPYCPDWSSVNQASIWLLFWENIVNFESSFNPNATYVETTLGTDPTTGAPVVSAGLFSLSYQDASNYGGACSAIAYSNPQAIFNPTTNATCAMYIANSLLAQGRSLGAYWSTARSGSQSMNTFKTIAPSCFK